MKVRGNLRIQVKKVQRSNKEAIDAL
ncbi:MAG: hypothetical protein RIQ95_1424, partial [Pseudomonadota bacterium]